MPDMAPTAFKLEEAEKIVHRLNQDVTDPWLYEVRSIPDSPFWGIIVVDEDNVEVGWL